MADTVYHLPFPMIQTETRQIPNQEVFHEEDEIKWDEIDHHLILMSLCIAERILRKNKTRVEVETKVQMRRRLKLLIREFRDGKIGVTRE